MFGVLGVLFENCRNFVGFKIDFGVCFCPISLAFKFDFSLGPECIFSLDKNDGVFYVFFCWIFLLALILGESGTRGKLDVNICGVGSVGPWFFVRLAVRTILLSLSCLRFRGEEFFCFVKTKNDLSDISLLLVDAAGCK